MRTIKKIEGYITRILLVGSLALIGCEANKEYVSENTVVTAEINFVSETMANGGGSVENGGKAIVNSKGICWNTQPMPTKVNMKTVDGTGDGSFFSQLDNLSPNTTYYVRAYATNSLGTTYGNEVTFKTKSSDLPILQTTPIANITATGGKSGGTIIYEGISSVTERGVCWSVNNAPTITDQKTINGNGLGTFTSTIYGLNPDFSYYVRAYATNSSGTAYGNSIFVKPFKSSITDIDGNVYTTVAIGTQIWTVENLNVTKYQNGVQIANISDNALWNTTENGAYCNYDNDALNSIVYGKLYNWFAAVDARNIAPEGWRVATYEDYQILIDYLGGPGEAAEKMNKGVFKALPGGKRNRDGVFYDLNTHPYFWTSTEYHIGSAWARYLILDEGDLDIINLSKNYGFSVRCVRN